MNIFDVSENRNYEKWVRLFSRLCAPNDIASLFDALQNFEIRILTLKGQHEFVIWRGSWEQVD